MPELFFILVSLFNLFLLYYEAFDQISEIFRPGLVDIGVAV
jgi:hypothetical protein